MGMSSYVLGIVPPDDKWKRMKEVYDACVAAKIQIPREVEKFFGDEPPDPKGVVIDQCGLGQAVKAYSAESREGFEVDITKLPGDVKIIRFVNSW